MENVIPKLVEEKIKEYFPVSWSDKNVIFFLRKSRYEMDVSAVNESLNLPIRDFILRRGKPTCHINFGLDVATNTGIGLHVLPLRLLLEKSNKLNQKQQIRIWEAYAEELINLTFGQGLDIFWHRNPDKNKTISVEKYLEMVCLKTGSLMRMSLRLACAIAETSRETEDAFKVFAEDIGIAFQIIDDSLDLTSQDTKFGKAYGNDITEGKLSLPVICALETSDNGDRLVEILSLHTTNKKLLTEAISIITDSGSLKKSLTFANEMIDQSWKKLESSVSGELRLAGLKELAYYFIQRTQ